MTCEKHNWHTTSKETRSIICKNDGCYELKWKFYFDLDDLMLEVFQYSDSYFCPDGHENCFIFPACRRQENIKSELSKLREEVKYFEKVRDNLNSSVEFVLREKEELNKELELLKSENSRITALLSADKPALKCEACEHNRNAIVIWSDNCKKLEQAKKEIFEIWKCQKASCFNTCEKHHELEKEGQKFNPDIKDCVRCQAKKKYLG